MNSQTATIEKVGNFYNKSTIAKFYEMIKKQHMHIGYWDDKQYYNDDIEIAAKRLTDKMISLTDVQPDQLFIDIGCGFGLPGIMLAKQKKCKVIGVTASSYQAESANRNSLKENLNGQATFLVENANELSFSDNTFDSGWFFESIFHMGHDTVLKEAHRVLKPGATLLIADFIRIGKIQQDDYQFLVNEFGIKSSVEIGDYPQLLENSGFDVLDINDITRNTIDQEESWGVHIEIIKKQNDVLIPLLGRNKYDNLLDFFTKLHKIGKGTIGYCIVKAKNLK
ncbi:MAG: methyltransferase domain-containing protein [Spirochaetales bacterium]|nr:methyltransferase domain-containing protein [Spirochaetales bacterium]